jgi:hypothetical protein
MRRLGLILRPPTHTYGFRGLRYIYEPPPPRMPRVGLRWYQPRLRGLGDSGYSDPVTGEWIDTSGQAAAGAIGPGIQPGDAYYLNQMRQQAVIDQNPLDYVSPQAAINAGLDVTVVNAAWARGLAKYATQQDAILAGIAPTAIVQFWQQSRAYVGAPSTTSTLLTPKNLMIGGGLLFGLALAFGGGKGKR